MSSSLPRVSAKILQYLDKIDEGSGRAKRMDFLRIAGNEAILNDWVEYLIQCNLIKAETFDGKRSYLKTEMGEKLHEVLKYHSYLGPLMGDLSRNRRKPK
ncbi:MAG TPA: hypothetical protein VFF30_13400 [Nitrososphaerales archaeon]|nr:hypothetical protein [Nitrososphaerales archaeon]